MSYSQYSIHYPKFINSIFQFPMSSYLWNNSTPDQLQLPHLKQSLQRACRVPCTLQSWTHNCRHVISKKRIYYHFALNYYYCKAIKPHLARGAIPLAFPNSWPCILTGIPLFPAAIDAVWLLFKTTKSQPKRP